MKRTTSLLLLSTSLFMFSGCENNPFVQSEEEGFEVEEYVPSLLTLSEEEDSFGPNSMSEEQESFDTYTISGEEEAESLGPKEGKEITKAFAAVSSKSGSKVVGAVTFIQEDDGVRIMADIGGLTPGKHGFHIHEHGDCSAADASSAGGHYNPTGQKHGGPDDAERHVGDFGNLEANEYGFAHYDRVDTVIELNGPNSIVGKSVVVHDGEDDLVSQPSGDAGSRIGCGVIHPSAQ